MWDIQYSLIGSSFYSFIQQIIQSDDYVLDIILNIDDTSINNIKLLHSWTFLVVDTDNTCT